MDRPDARWRASVLIVGAGPTGLMLANQLARRGVPHLLIDRNEGPSVRTKALGVQARTLEIYARLGIVDRALELGLKAEGAVMWANGSKAAEVPLGDIGRDLSPYPFLLILGQDDNERILGDALRERGADVHWNTELTGLAQDEDGVSTTLRRRDGSLVEVRADWVAGCDGARSAVRSLCDIPFLGAPYDEVFFVADTRATGPMAPDRLNVFLWRGGFHLFFPMRGTDHWRIAGILPPALRDSDDVVFESLIPSIRNEVGARLDFGECRWFSTYRIHHRRAERFQRGRCFLLGDAAHIHSPVGAQGMNTGLQDAYNLAWKLALVAKGQADPALLDTYRLEREPVADRLLRTTDRAFSFLISDQWLAERFRTRILPRTLRFAMGRTLGRELAFRVISQIGIRYPSSPLSRAGGDADGHGVRAGDRFPWLHVEWVPGGPMEDVFSKLDDTRFNLILVGQQVAAELGDGLRELVHVLTVPDTLENRSELERRRMAIPSFHLLRPDGYVGLVGGRFDAKDLEDYFRDAVRLRAPGVD